MRKNVIETIIGAVVLLVAVVFVAFAFTSTDLQRVDGYKVVARFDDASGITPGTDVKMSGVKIGTVLEQKLDPKTYFADVTMSIAEEIALPTDTSARVVPEGLLGGNFVELEPGASSETLSAGGEIQFTQGAINVIDLVGRFVFSGNEGGGTTGQDSTIPP
ncbi:MAG: outer membrane lipid asymmetry maintenance protein MlaD [Rhodovibrionaceae bacterium]|nr:outer membrane lipid asymmetry maintenance protein MlaD [Rhodovibrionaceae bacterium]